MMKPKGEQSPDRDSQFGVILSNQDYQRAKELQESYKYLQNSYEKLQIQRQVQAAEIKQLFKKVMLMARRTIQIEEQNIALKAKYQTDTLKQSKKQKELNKQNEKLQNEKKRQLELLNQKDEQILKLTTQVQKLTNILKTYQQGSIQKMQKADNDQRMINQQTKAKELQKQRIKLLEQQNQYFRDSLKPLSSKLIAINKNLCQFKKIKTKKECQQVETNQKNQSKGQDIYHSIIMEGDTEIYLIQKNLQQLQNCIQQITKQDPFFMDCSNCKNLQQQTSNLQAQNAAILKRLSNLEYKNSVELNLEVIRKKYQSMLETTNDKYEINRQVYNLMKVYQKAIQDEYDSIVYILFKDEDSSKSFKFKEDPLFGK